MVDFLKCADQAAFDIFNADAATRIKAILPRQFTQYTYAISAVSGLAVYAVVDDDFLTVASDAEKARILTESQAHADGMAALGSVS